LQKVECLFLEKEKTMDEAMEKYSSGILQRQEEGCPRALQKKSWILIDVGNFAE
jgi:hypothetical protein